MSKFGDKWNDMFEKIKLSKYEWIVIPLVILLLPVSQTYRLYWFLRRKITGEQSIEQMLSSINNKT